MSKALNELKKATMASYLAKAGGVLRADTKIGLDFEHDAYRDLKTVNRHSEYNMDGKEKDPVIRAKAEKSMKTNTDLANQFKRGAKNRIKGIARAGRLLAKEGVELTKKGTPRKPATGIQKAAAAGTLGKELNAEIKKAAYKPTLVDKIKSKLRKEEAINERNTESHPSLWNTHELRHDSGKVLKKGDVVKDFRGDKHKIKGFELPHHSGSTGRVYTSQGSFFPGVVDAKIVKKAVKEDAEQIDETGMARMAAAAVRRTDPDYEGSARGPKDPVALARKQHGAKAADAIDGAEKAHWGRGYGSKGKPAPYAGSDPLDRQPTKKTVGGKVNKQAANALKAKIKSNLKSEEVEEVNEVSRSTIAKVATARYNQAQAALKQKDFGGYVKNMGKAIKAADKTTPNVGWSPEDDNTKKNEEVVVSPQERYRQIKEARLAKSAKPTTTHHNFYIAHEDTDEAAGILAQHKIPHSVADHSSAPVDHSVISVRHKHRDAARAAFKKNGIDFGGR